MNKLEKKAISEATLIAQKVNTELSNLVFTF